MRSCSHYCLSCWYCSISCTMLCFPDHHSLVASYVRRWSREQGGISPRDAYEFRRAHSEHIPTGSLTQAWSSRTHKIICLFKRHRWGTWQFCVIADSKRVSTQQNDRRCGVWVGWYERHCTRARRKATTCTDAQAAAAVRPHFACPHVTVSRG